MKIVLNGDAMDTDCTTLQELLEQLKHEEGSVATAVNSEFVPIALRESLKLHSGDQVEIIAPMSGG